MSTVSGLEIANRVEAEWRDRLDAAVNAERNKLAAWMIRFGFATGHGDTMEQLCDELGTEIVDRIDYEVDAEREHIAQSLEKQADLATDKFERTWALQMAAAVRARSTT